MAPKYLYYSSTMSLIPEIENIPLINMIILTQRSGASMGITRWSLEHPKAIERTVILVMLHPKMQ